MAASIASWIEMIADALGTGRIDDPGVGTSALGIDHTLLLRVDVGGVDREVRQHEATDTIGVLRRRHERHPRSPRHAPEVEAVQAELIGDLDDVGRVLLEGVAVGWSG